MLIAELKPVAGRVLPSNIAFLSSLIAFGGVMAIRPVCDIVAGCCLSSTSVADYNLKILEKQGLTR